MKKIVPIAIGVFSAFSGLTLCSAQILPVGNITPSVIQPSQQPPTVIDQTTMVPSSPASLVAGSGSVGSEYVLGAGDIIGVVVTPQVKYSVVSTSVLEDGTILYPKIGTIVVAGKTVAQLSQEISNKLSDYCINPNVSVNVQALRPQVVYVSGGVGNPRILDIHAGTNLVKAISLAGGARDLDALSHVAVMRGSDVLVRDVYSLMVLGIDNGQNITLQTGDLVIVPTNTLAISVIGAVDHPGLYGLRIDNPSSTAGPERLSDALSTAGGADKHGARVNNINVVRLVAGSPKPIVLTFDYGKFLKDGDPKNNPILQDRDIVVVQSQKTGGNTLQGAINLLSSISIARTLGF